MKLFFLLCAFFLHSTLIFAEPNLADAKIGDNIDSLKKTIHPKFECKTSDSNKSTDICRITYCNSFEDKKCSLWGEKDLSYVRIYSSLNANKLEKMIIDLDYLNIKPQEYLKIIDILEKKLGKSDECLGREFFKDPKAVKGIITCNWKGKSANLELYVDDARLKLKLEKANN